MANFYTKIRNDDPPLYPRHDWEQLKRLWSKPEIWSLWEQLIQRGRIFKEVFISNGWPPSTEALSAVQKLSEAQINILRLRRRIKNGEVVPEEMERNAYGLYAEALNQLESSTNYRLPSYKIH